MLINKLDKDGNGTISLDELKSAEWILQMLPLKIHIIYITLQAFVWYMCVVIIIQNQIKGYIIKLRAVLHRLEIVETLKKGCPF